MLSLDLFFLKYPFTQSFIKYISLLLFSCNIFSSLKLFKINWSFNLIFFYLMFFVYEFRYFFFFFKFIAWFNDWFITNVNRWFDTFIKRVFNIRIFLRRVRNFLNRIIIWILIHFLVFFITTIWSLKASFFSIYIFIKLFQSNKNKKIKIWVIYNFSCWLILVGNSVLQNLIKLSEWKGIFLLIRKIQ